MIQTGLLTHVRTAIGAALLLVAGAAGFSASAQNFSAIPETGAPAIIDAQYFPPPPPPGYAPPPRYAPPPPRYEQPRYERRRQVEEYDPYYAPRRATRYGQVCVTSRGECYVYRPQPINSGCRCEVPGFGLKRGAIQY